MVKVSIVVAEIPESKPVRQLRLGENRVSFFETKLFFCASHLDLQSAPKKSPFRLARYSEGIQDQFGLPERRSLPTTPDYLSQFRPSYYRETFRTWGQDEMLERMPVL